MGVIRRPTKLEKINNFPDQVYLSPVVTSSSYPVGECPPPAMGQTFRQRKVLPSGPWRFSRSLRFCLTAVTGDRQMRYKRDSKT